MDFNQTRLYEKDEFRWGVGFDWKIKINWLNPKAFFVVTPEFVHHEILDAEKTLASGPTGDFVQQPILMNEYLHDKSDYSISRQATGIPRSCRLLFINMSQRPSPIFFFAVLLTSVTATGTSRYRRFFYTAITTVPFRRVKVTTAKTIFPLQLPTGSSLKVVIRNNRRYHQKGGLK
jgi:hypothetical protein